MTHAIDKQDFAWFRDFLRTESGIAIDETKDYLVATRLAPVLRGHEIAGFGQLVLRLKASQRSPLHQRVIEAMTTNETSFFRDVHPFETLRHDVLPGLVAKRGGAGLAIWCAASSTGQEPYTIAMVLREAFPQVAARSKILCTDINRAVLDRTERGTYSQMEVNRGLPPQLLSKYFQRQGTDWQAKGELRSMIDPRVLNLTLPWHGIPAMDIVFIRNVLIYFDLETKKSIVGRIRRSMVMGGVLFIGGAETLLNVDDGFTREVAGKGTVYRRSA